MRFATRETNWRHTCSGLNWTALFDPSLNSARSTLYSFCWIPTPLQTQKIKGLGKQWWKSWTMPSIFFISSKEYPSVAMASSNHSKSEPSSRISVRQMDPWALPLLIPVWPFPGHRAGRSLSVFLPLVHTCSVIVASRDPLTLTNPRL